MPHRPEFNTSRCLQSGIKNGLLYRIKFLFTIANKSLLLFFVQRKLDRGSSTLRFLIIGKLLAWQISKITKEGGGGMGSVWKVPFLDAILAGVPREENLRQYTWSS